MTVTAIPIEIENVAMDDTWKAVQIDPKWVTTQLQNSDAVDLEVSDDDQGTNVWTIKAGTVQHFSSGNFSAGNSVDTIYIKAASGTAQILGFLRR